jgi:PhoH-like ATPase
MKQPVLCISEYTRAVLHNSKRHFLSFNPKGDITMKHGNAMVVDTNILIHDPTSIITLMNDVNTIFLHSGVIMELNKLKGKSDIGRDCRQAIKLIEEFQIQNNYRLKIVRQSYFTDDLEHLDNNEIDHKIISLAYHLTNTNTKYDKVKLITRDAEMRIHARDLGIIVEDYESDNVNTRIPLCTQHFEIPYDIVDGVNLTINVNDVPYNNIIENECIICHIKDENETSFACIKKGDKYHILDNNINLMGIKPYSMCSSEYNWEQHIAMHQLLDPDIKVCFLIGSSGSGKTLLGLAAGIHNKKHYRNILVSRPMISLSGEDNMGYLPGGIEEKMAPWVKPIFRLLAFIRNTNEYNKKIIDNIRNGDKKKLDIEPIDYIRGNTFHNDYLLIDEAQNLTPTQIKSVITRCGEGTKIVFTGDLNQIDRPYLNKKSSGLNYASTKMKDNPMVSIINFNETVRSELVKFAEEVL